MKNWPRLLSHQPLIPGIIKSDYEDVATALVRAHRRFANGVYLLWYPVIQRAANPRPAKATHDKRERARGGKQSGGVREIARQTASP